MKSTVIAVDLAKNVFEIAVSVRPGKIRERKRLFAVLGAGELAAAITMVEQSRARLALHDSLPQSRQRELTIEPLRQRPADHRP